MNHQPTAWTIVVSIVSILVGCSTSARIPSVGEPIDLKTVLLQADSLTVMDSERCEEFDFKRFSISDRALLARMGNEICVVSDIDAAGITLTDPFWIHCRIVTTNRNRLREVRRYDFILYGLITIGYTKDGSDRLLELDDDGFAKLLLRELTADGRNDEKGTSTNESSSGKAIGRE